jgi:hypothetical protein
MRTQRWSTGKAPLIFNLGAKWGWVVNAPAAVPWVGPKAGAACSRRGCCQVLQELPVALYTGSLEANRSLLSAKLGSHCNLYIWQDAISVQWALRTAVPTVHCRTV